ncbi:HAD family hydrolase [Natrialbaceae archaeon GCM10025810]|uniref:HAD family hydrolase n=1 Tax=Halovalidus salilacus TaxID=3075124 RepID=UPI0036163821
MTSYAAICFDLDRTICEPTRETDSVLEAAFARAGVDPFCTAAEMRAAVPSLPTAETDREFFELLFAELAGRTGVDPALAPTLAESYLAERDPTAVRFRPGAEAALEYARERAPVGLITNGGRETQTRKLRALGIEDTFDAAVFTEPSAGIYPKPDLAPFEHALGTLGADPHEAIHVGDSLHADVAGANAVGMDSAWLSAIDGPDASASADHRPTYELPSLESFETIV